MEAEKTGPSKTITLIIAPKHQDVLFIVRVPSSQASQPHIPGNHIQVPKKHHLESPIIVLQSLNPPSYFFTTTFSGVAWLPWL